MRASLVIAYMVLGNGYAGATTNMPETVKTESWLDRPDILAVAFHPRREAPARASGFDALEIPVAPGVTIGGRFYAAGTNAPTILFFHGNGEIVADYDSLAPAYRALRINFMPVDYRGYGLSTGSPTLTSMLADARAVGTFARRWLKEHGYAGRFIVMGRSLGSASALELASTGGQDVDGLIIDSGFAHLVPLLARLGASRLPDADAGDKGVGQVAKIRAYPGPTLIIHGTRDFIIPISDAEDLYRAASSTNRQLLRIEGAGHNDILTVGHQEYFRAVSELAHRRGD